MAGMTSGRDPHEYELPPFSHALNGWFMWYVRRYLRRHFHAVRLLKDPEGGLVFLLVGAARYPNRMSYGPIDAAALGKYKFLERIGFIGIEPGTWRGSARFLRMARAALDRSDVLFWITAQGEFADPRLRPVEIRPGVGHAVAGGERGVVVPLAVEYPFWSERLPEALAAFGPARPIAECPGRSADDWTDLLAADLTATQDRLIERDPAGFTTLLSGRVGVGPAYDTGRRVGAWLRGRRFDPSHGGEGEAAS